MKGELFEDIILIFLPVSIIGQLCSVIKIFKLTLVRFVDLRITRVRPTFREGGPCASLMIFCTGKFQVSR